MTDLSPSAQAVFDAFTEDDFLHDWKHNHYNTDALAAALRAAADQAHPKSYLKDIIGYVHQNYIDGWKDALDAILAIASELEAKAND
jgi:hypothetical protein